MLFVVLLLFAITAVLVYLFLIGNFNFWQKRGVIGPKPKVLVGNFPSIFTQKRHMVYDLDDIYRSFKKKADYVGIYSSKFPQLLIINPELVHRVLVNDFAHFHDNEVSAMVDENSDFLFASNPFNLTGEKWKDRRSVLSPGMTTNRIKAVYPVTSKICKSLTDYIRNQVKMAPKDGLDGKDISLRFTTEVVTDCVLGLDAQSFSNKPSPIVDKINKLFDQSVPLLLYFILSGLFPKLREFYKTRFIPKPTEVFFIDLMQKAVEIRKPEPNKRMDYMQYLLQLQDKKQLNMKELTAHTMTFLLDGFETTAGVLSQCLLLLARYPEVQEKLRQEIEKHWNNENDIDFDQLSEMPYLDACVHETVRLFPPGLISSKLCTKPIQLTNKDGSTLNLETNTVVVLPFYSIMHDEEYYPNPEEFQPERFLPENGGVKKYRDLGIYEGFSDGPRICLGMRFALIQLKASISHIIHNFNVHVNPKTRNDNLLDPKYFLARIDGGIWLDFEERK